MRLMHYSGTLAALAVAVAAAQLDAQTRVVLPAGTVILVRTNAALESATAKAGQTFEAVVSDTVQADTYTLIPSGSRIRGVVTFARAATRAQSGVIEVDFDRIALPGGQAYAMDGKLTSTDATERKQIDADANARVVLVGGRGGIGAGIAGAGSSSRPESNILAALGTMLSEGRDVSVPAGTALAVQLERDLSLPSRGFARGNNRTLFLAAARIRAAQDALIRQNYYDGPITGRMNDATQRALAQYQIDKGLSVSGNLDVATAQALGITTSVGGDVSTAMVLSTEQAATLRRSAQSLVAQERVDLRVASNGRLSTARTYSAADLETWFALSAFADNASLYETLVRVSATSEGTANAGKALIAAAKRVDAALNASTVSTSVRNNWSTVRGQLRVLDPTY
jgi:peptidoglycan hydrolase-like protein with peptidoglycan-binding domain